MLDKKLVPPALAEFLGTAILVTVFLVLAQTTGVSYFIGTSVALALGVVYMLFSGVSGGHFNPAITFGMWASRRIRTIPAISYLIAQFLGGFAALQLFQYLADREVTSKAANYTSMSVWLPVLVAELVGTMVLAMGFAAAISRRLSALESALTYGAAFFVGIMIAATAAAANLNPAIAVFVRGFGWDWVYIIGPLLGGLIGIGLYNYLFGAVPFKSFNLATIRRWRNKIAAPPRKSRR